MGQIFRYFSLVNCILHQLYRIKSNHKLMDKIKLIFFVKFLKSELNVDDLTQKPVL